jgi:hypothetical protein
MASRGGRTNQRAARGAKPRPRVRFAGSTEKTGESFTKSVEFPAQSWRERQLKSFAKMEVRCENADAFL